MDGKRTHKIHILKLRLKTISGQSSSRWRDHSVMWKLTEVWEREKKIPRMRTNIDKHSFSMANFGPKKWPVIYIAMPICIGPFVNHSPITIWDASTIFTFVSSNDFIVCDEPANVVFIWSVRQQSGFRTRKIFSCCDLFRGNNVLHTKYRSFCYKWVSFFYFKTWTMNMIIFGQEQQQNNRNNNSIKTKDVNHTYGYTNIVI